MSLTFSQLQALYYKIEAAERYAVDIGLSEIAKSLDKQMEQVFQLVPARKH